MTFDQIYDEEPTVTRGQARHEIARHGLNWSDFTAECGDSDQYNGADVLNWLGY